MPEKTVPDPDRADKPGPGEASPRTPHTLLDLIIASGGGFIPEDGLYNVTSWSAFIQRTPATIREWIKNHKIPHSKPGDEAFISAEDFRRSIPYITQEDDSDGE